MKITETKNLLKFNDMDTSIYGCRQVENWLIDFKKELLEFKQYKIKKIIEEQTWLKGKSPDIEVINNSIVLKFISTTGSHITYGSEYYEDAIEIVDLEGDTVFRLLTPYDIAEYLDSILPVFTCYCYEIKHLPILLQIMLLEWLKPKISETLLEISDRLNLDLDFYVSFEGIKCKLKSLSTGLDVAITPVYSDHEVFFEFKIGDTSYRITLLDDREFEEFYADFNRIRRRLHNIRKDHNFFDNTSNFDPFNCLENIQPYLDILHEIQNESKPQNENTKYLKSLTDSLQDLGK